MARQIQECRAAGPLAAKTILRRVQDMLLLQVGLKLLMHDVLHGLGKLWQLGYWTVVVVVSAIFFFEDRYY